MHDPGRRVCAVCSRVLDEVEGKGWRHPLTGGEPADHPAVPVLDTEVPARGLCDFCSADGTAWVLPVRDFATVPGVSASRGDWAACDACASLIRRGKWNELLDRAAHYFTLRHGPMPPEMRSSLRRLYAAVRRNATGPLRRDG